jgi:hypothetical protein
MSQSAYLCHIEIRDSLNMTVTLHIQRDLNIGRSANLAVLSNHEERKLRTLRSPTLIRPQPGP